MRQKAVLIVDDSKTITAIVAKVMNDAGFADVERVHDGATALEMMSKKSYGLVITDWEMQPMKGPELIKKIRADRRFAEVRTILLTALQDKHDDAWLDGADGYVTKPFEPRDLTDKVEEILSDAA